MSGDRAADVCPRLVDLVHRSLRDLGMPAGAVTEAHQAYGAQPEHLGLSVRTWLGSLRPDVLHGTLLAMLPSLPALRGVFPEPGTETLAALVGALRGYPVAQDAATGPTPEQDDEQGT